MKFFGLEAQQSHESVVALAHVLEQEEPECIIEFGTKRGGMTVLFGVYGHSSGAMVHTMDIVEPMACSDIFSKLGVKFHLVDIFTRYAQHRVADWIGDGSKTLLFCDNGKRAQEFNLYAPLLKKGDIIMAHDYAETSEAFEKMSWGCQELQGSDIARTVRDCGLIPLYEDVCSVGVMCCFRKNDND